MYITSSRKALLRSVRGVFGAKVCINARQRRMGLGPVQVLPCNWSREFLTLRLCEIGELRHHVGNWDVGKDCFLFSFKRSPNWCRVRTVVNYIFLPENTRYGRRGCIAYAFTQRHIFLQLLSTNFSWSSYVQHIVNVLLRYTILETQAPQFSFFKHSITAN